MNHHSCYFSTLGTIPITLLPCTLTPAIFFQFPRQAMGNCWTNKSRKLKNQEVLALDNFRKTTLDTHNWPWLYQKHQSWILPFIFFKQAQGPTKERETIQHCKWPHNRSCSNISKHETQTMKEKKQEEKPVSCWPLHCHNICLSLQRHKRSVYFLSQQFRA